MTSTQSSFMHLAPYVVEKLWGGRNLKAMKGLSSNELVGETWEVSTLKQGPSLFNGQPLNQAIPDLKYLIKFIDTTDYLSVQVHPDDDYAKRVESSSGKTECWFVLKAEPGAGIYLGFKPEVKKDDFAEAISNHQNLSDFLVFYPVKPGDFFYVPAGSIHAIGKGVTLIEVQQSSGITYRVWDWNRLEKDGKPRQLDVAKALDVLNFRPEANSAIYFRYTQNSFSKSEPAFINHPDFNISLMKLEKGLKMNINLDEKKIYAVVNVQGKVQLQLGDDQSVLATYESCVIKPESKGTFNMQAEQEALVLVVR